MTSERPTVRRNWKSFWLIAPGLLLPMIAGVALLLSGYGGPLWPPRSVAATRALAALFLANDLAIAIALVSLLVSRDEWLPNTRVGPFPFSEKWLWCFLVAFLVFAYLSLTPMFLYLYVTMKR